MWEIQSDWNELKSFWVKIGETKYQISKNDQMFNSPDKTISVDSTIRNQFTISTPQGRCTFIAPSKKFQTHKDSSVNCLSVTADGDEVLSGDCFGKLYLKYRDTEPVPMEGPTSGFDVEDCIIDKKLGQYFSCGGDFSIYAFSNEYFNVGKYKGHKASVKRILIDGEFLYSGSDDCTIKKWDIKHYNTLSTADVADPVTDFCFGTNAIYVSTSTSIRALDLRTSAGIVSPDNGSASEFSSVAFYNDKIVAGTDSGTICLWDSRNLGAPISEWNWYDSMINKLRYHNNRLWVATNDGTAAAIDPETKTSSIVLGTPSFEAVKAIAFSDSKVFTSGATGEIAMFDL
ncbi:hypothetical protein TVAG_005970 [Trichomonas vaginalis G3]|uniref:Uncharacterized protein n=1 Tax=Trichomonas vaginalis (strain ATCC PRA-98 / G3) TaxID=412133 RepID=A2E704_TRIV3|nr:WD40 repeat-like family [Trichomonas vaginalis G3]EAY11522.1 hypothetical protein TVAG_005970 [Trichomonas vaginalis G3]KAI5489406.1 WD40 repeat-like family [Trichomonas vaginalis G3]|eukprot:XP_001323745.1 hypothetical protein [Trichomonas vaginalis G3]